jgi:hypothetical protein
MAPRSRSFLAVLLLGLPAATTAASPREDKPPEPLIAALKKATLGEWCQLADQKSLPLEVQQWFELPDGSLALVVQVPDYLCEHTNTAVPVVVSPKGDWKWGKPLAGKLRHVTRAAGGNFWAVAEWQIEDPYPKLLRTLDGLEWAEVELPAARSSAGRGETVDCLVVRPKPEALDVWFEKDTEPAQAWSLPLAAGGQWRQAQRSPECPAQAGSSAGAWSRNDSAEDRFVFKKGAKAVAIPKALTWP